MSTHTELSEVDHVERMLTLAFNRRLNHPIHGTVIAFLQQTPPSGA